MNHSKPRRFFITLLLIASAFAAGWWGREKSLSPHYTQTTNIKKALSQSPLLNQVLENLNASYLEKEKLNDQEKLIYGAISGLVNSLGDPYTVFLPPKENKQFQQNLAGSFGGVGIQLGYKEKQLTVIAPLEGTPAERAGIKAGDIIIHIKDKKKEIDRDTFDMSLPEAVSIIRGPKGTPVELTVIREKEPEPLKITIVRGEIKVPSVVLKFLSREEKNIAHLKLTRFGDQTEQEWENAISQIVSFSQNHPLEGVIFDLRNNPGGYLDGAVYIASEFIDQGVVVRQESREKKEKTFSVSRTGQLLKTPLVILVNGGTASASEIVAGALRQLRGAKIIGETTFGKGTVQESRPLWGGAGIHITIARWLLPDGTSIHKKGIKPDIIVHNDPDETEKDAQLEKAIDVLLKKE